MPVYQTRCLSCKHEELQFSGMDEREALKCSSCGGKTDRPPTSNKPFANVWKPLVLDHIADEPMLFETRKSLVDHCNKTGLSSGALL